MTLDGIIKVTTPPELIAVLPYLIGFHPADSVAVVALSGRQLTFAARYDLPGPDRPIAEIRRDAAEVAQLVANHEVTAATVIGYGPADRVDPTMQSLATALQRIDIPVFDRLRVADGRWWSYSCPDQLCSPDEGLPCLPPDSAIAAAATFSGAVALPSRAALVAQLASAGTVAPAAAEKRLARLGGRAPNGAREVRRAGRLAVREAEWRYRRGRRLSDGEVAWLGVLLARLPVRDYAWGRTGDEEWWISLWKDVLRRVEPPYLPAPAGLLGFAAWRAGQGALARVAIDRVLEQDPEYEMAILLNELIQLGVHPKTVEGWPHVVSQARRASRRRAA